jgi:hypothetical protein
MNLKESHPSLELIQRAVEILGSLPPTYQVGVDWIDGYPIEWREFENDSGTAAFDALEEAGHPITIEAISALRIAIDKSLRSVPTAVDPKG